jgi:hypothetical protein
MADKTADADHLARDPRITAAAASSMNALKPLMLFQGSMLGCGPTALRGSRTTMKRRWMKPVEERSDRKRAA